MNDISSKQLSWEVFWWTNTNLIPVRRSSGRPVLLKTEESCSPTDPVGMPAGVKFMKIVVRESLRLRSDKNILVVPASSSALIPDDATFDHILSGKYGHVSAESPIRILIVGDWTMTGENWAVSFKEWLRRIWRARSIPPLPTAIVTCSTDCAWARVPVWVDRDCSAALEELVEYFPVLPQEEPRTVSYQMEDTLSGGVERRCSQSVDPTPAYGVVEGPSTSRSASINLRSRGSELSCRFLAPPSGL
jgi:hypothetical protein